MVRTENGLMVIAGLVLADGALLRSVETPDGGAPTSAAWVPGGGDWSAGLSAPPASPVALAFFVAPRLQAPMALCAMKGHKCAGWVSVTLSPHYYSELRLAEPEGLRILVCPVSSAPYKMAKRSARRSPRALYNSVASNTGGW